MGQKAWARCSFVAVCAFCRSKSAVTRREKDARALNQSQTSLASARRQNWQRRKGSIAANTLDVYAIDSKRKSRKKLATLFSMANPINVYHTSRIFHSASLRGKAC